MIWAKTEAGKVEVQARALVKERVQRNLLLLIDGVKTEEMLLANVAGLKPEDFGFLASLNLIAPAAGSSSRAGAATRPGALSSAKQAKTTDTPAPALDYAQLGAALTELIANELGLRGFSLTLAVEKSRNVDELREVAERVLDQIRDRKGLPAASKARHALFGGS